MSCFYAILWEVDKKWSQDAVLKICLLEDPRGSTDGGADPATPTTQDQSLRLALLSIEGQTCGLSRWDLQGTGFS